MGLKTHCLNGHEFSEANTYMRTENWRVCRTCQNQRNRDWRATRPRKLHANHLPARIVDLLSIDGGWLTADGIALALTADSVSVVRSLHRLKGMGFVDSRQVLLATGLRGHVDVRLEWVALDHALTLF